MIGLFNYYFGCFFVNEYAFFLSKAVWLVLWINSLYMLLVVSERQIKAFFRLFLCLFNLCCMVIDSDRSFCACFMVC